MRIVNEIDKAIAYDFCIVVMANGHRHTIKAYGTYNQWTGSEAYDLENQKAYIEYMSEHEQTEIDHFECTQSKKDALKNEIIDTETQGFI